MPIGPKVKALIGAVEETKRRELLTSLGVANVDAIESRHFDAIKLFCNDEISRIASPYRPEPPGPGRPAVPIENRSHPRRGHYEADIASFQNLKDKIDAEHRADQVANPGALAEDQRRSQSNQLLTEKTDLESELSSLRDLRKRKREDQVTELRSMIQQRFRGIFQTDNWAALFMFMVMLFPDSYDKVLKKLYDEIQLTYQEGKSEKDIRDKISQLVQDLAVHGEAEIQAVNLDEIPDALPAVSPSPTDMQHINGILDAARSGPESAPDPDPISAPVPVP